MGLGEKFPEERRFSGESVRNFPSTVGIKGNCKKPLKMSCFDQISSAVKFFKHLSLRSLLLWVQPTLSASRRERFLDSWKEDTAHGLSGQPLWRMACWNLCLEESLSRCRPTLTPPALSPNKVTLCGLPPKLPILFRTHLIASTCGVVFAYLLINW